MTPVSCMSSNTYPDAPRKFSQKHQNVEFMNSSSFQQHHQYQRVASNAFPVENNPNLGIMKSLFGANATEWPYSEDSLNKALTLKIQQETTKQEYYKVEKLNRVIELLKLAAIAKIPGHLIPSLFDTQLSQTNRNEKDILNQNQILTPPTSASNSPSSTTSTHQRHHRGKTIANLSELKNGGNTVLESLSSSSQAFNNNIEYDRTSMKSFKFGSGSGSGSGFGSSSSQSRLSSHIHKRRTLLPPKHQLSPSRIGAHAISSLNNLRGKRSVDPSHFAHGSRHNRTLSLPASVTIPESKTLDFHSHESSLSNNNFKEIIIPELNHSKTSICSFNSLSSSSQISSFLAPPMKSSSKDSSSNSLCAHSNSNDSTHISGKESMEMDITSDDDVEKLINGSLNEQTSPLSHKQKPISGSPLKEMIAFHEDREEDEEKRKVDDGSRIKSFSQSAVNSPYDYFSKNSEIEPKTP